MTPNALRSWKSAGFTLLEIVVSLVVLALLLFSLGFIVLNSQMRMRGSSHRDIAYSLAESMIDQIRDMKWEDVEKDTTYSGLVPDPPQNAGMPNQYPPAPYPSFVHESNYPEPGTGSIVTHGKEYRFIVRTLYDTANSVNEDLTFVTVGIYWEETAGGVNAARDIVLQSEIFRRDQ